MIGAFLYISVVWFVGWDKFRSAFLLLNPVFILYLCATLLTSIFIRLLKWRYMVDSRPITQLYFMSKAGGALTPSRVGELSPLLLEKYRTPRVAAWIVVDRLMEIAATLAIGALGAMTLGANGAGLLPAVGLAGLVFVLIPTLIMTRRNLFTWMENKITRPAALTHAFAFLSNSSEEFGKFGPKLFIAGALTIAATSVDVCSGLLMYKGFGQHPTFGLLAAAQCMHGIVSAIPFLPNVTGAPYFAVGLMLNRIGGIPLEIITAVVAAYLVIENTIFWGALGFSAWLWGNNEK
jgi:hypothetical protein